MNTYQKIKGQKKALADAEARRERKREAEKAEQLAKVAELPLPKGLRWEVELSRVDRKHIGGATRWIYRAQRGNEFISRGYVYYDKESDAGPGWVVSLMIDDVVQNAGAAFYAVDDALADLVDSLQEMAEGGLLQ